MKLLRIAFIIFFAVCVYFPVNTAVASPAQDQLENSIKQILEILRDPAMKGDTAVESRREALRKVIYERFSFKKMSQGSLARHWKKRSKEEKNEFVKVFGQLLEETYVSKVESYTDEKVEYVKDIEETKKKYKIYTRIITESVEIPIDYKMYLTKSGSWMVYDIVIEGVSLVANYRSQFNQTLEKKSYPELLEDLKKKLDS